MPYVAIVNLNRPKQYLLPVPFADFAKAQEWAISRVRNAHGLSRAYGPDDLKDKFQILDLYLPEKAYTKWRFAHGTHLCQEAIDDFLAMNESHKKLSKTILEDAPVKERPVLLEKPSLDEAQGLMSSCINDDPEYISTHLLGKDCSWAYDPVNEEFIPSISAAITHYAFTIIPALAKQGADPNQESDGATPLQRIVHITCGLSQSNKWGIKLFDMLYAIGAKIDQENCLGVTPLLEATIRNNVLAIDFLTRKGATIAWTPGSTLKDLQALYEQLELKIGEGLALAQQEGVLFLLMGGEYHKSYRSKLIQAMMVNIMHRFGVKNYYLEQPPTENDVNHHFDVLYDIELCMATHYKMDLFPIDIYHGTHKFGTSTEGIKQREQGMVDELLKAKYNAPGMLSVGMYHLMIAEEPRLKAKYKICPISVDSPTFLLERGDQSDWLATRHLYSEKHCILNKLNGNWMKSKEVVMLLQELAKATSIETRHQILIERDIFKTAPLFVSHFHPVVTRLKSALAPASKANLKNFISQVSDNLERHSPEHRRAIVFFPARHIASIRIFIQKLNKISSRDPNIDSCKATLLKETKALFKYLDDNKSVRTIRILEATIQDALPILIRKPLLVNSLVS